MNIVLFRNADDLINSSDTIREKTENIITAKVYVNGREYTISEYDGKLEIRATSGELLIHPQAQNMILVSLDRF